MVEYSTTLSVLENIITCLHNKNRTLWQLVRGTGELRVDQRSSGSTSGVGTFSITHYKPYTGVNPETPERVNVKAKRKPVFRVGKQLKKAVDDNRS
jgi:hypothetical protein